MRPCCADGHTVGGCAIMLHRNPGPCKWLNAVAPALSLLFAEDMLARVHELRMVERCRGASPWRWLQRQCDVDPFHCPAAEPRPCTFEELHFDASHPNLAP